MPLAWVSCAGSRFRGTNREFVQSNECEAAAAMTASSAIMFALGALCGLSVGVLVMSLIYDR